MTHSVQIIAVPTVTKLDQSAIGSVVIGGSHAALFTTFLTVNAGAHAAIQHDACIGRNEAGVGGLAWAEQFGFAMAAIDGQSARIGDGDDMLANGRISRMNTNATKCGVQPGMGCKEAAELLRNAPAPTSRPAPLQETRQNVTLGGGMLVAVMDSVALADENDRGQIIATGSHGGKPSAAYAAKIAPRVVLFNDAGFGPDSAGIASFSHLDEKGIGAVAVSVFTADIGNGQSTLRDGVISAANACALKLGARIGWPAIDFVESFAPQEGHR